ncbi:MAG: hypothetical protein NTV23_00535 [Propionibacteriales bacterium]|nr:hypothetical protein [Propionibacteriales bacterium]
MPITLASDTFSDAAVTDSIGRGDLTAAARLWVRHWPSALASARLYVERREVPGLAAEALIGTVSMTALGRGPREDVASFVAAAVRELGEDDEPPPIDVAALPEVSTSPRLSQAFAALPLSARAALRDFAHGGPEAPEALTLLQTGYLVEHAADAPGRECRPAHGAMLAAAEERATEGFAGDNWMHMSTCVWCTEAFHELAHSNCALSALIAPAVLAADAAAPLPTPLTDQVAEPVLAAVATHRAGVHVVLRGGRNRILMAAGLTVAVALIAVLVSQNLTGNDDPTSPTAASGASSTPTAAATNGNDAFVLGSPLPSPTGLPSDLPSATVAGPLVLPEPTGTASTPAAKPTPTRTPTPKPSPSSTPKPTPTPTPTPAPSTSPTPTCNPLQHVLGFC